MKVPHPGPRSEEAVELSNAVRAALAKTNEKDTLVLVTADHSHVFTIAGYPARGNDILGKVVSLDDQGEPADEYATDANGLPYTTLSYANGPGYRVGGRPDLTDVDTTHVEFLQEATVPMGSETHAGEGRRPVRPWTQRAPGARQPGANHLKAVCYV